MENFEFLNLEIHTIKNQTGIEFALQASKTENTIHVGPCL